MPLASAAETPADPPIDLKHFERPTPPEPVTREFREVTTGEVRPANETLSAEDAAKELGRTRAQEFEALEAQQNQDLTRP